ncbi:MAG: hypothetical protein ACJ788_19860 [Ktedonobacteraceae bacterium]
MQFLSIFITIVLGALALSFVLYPFYRRTPTQADDAARVQNASSPRTKRLVGVNANGDPLQSPDAATAAQTDREQAARSALREIELDYQLGNISEADYRTLRERYVRRALVALKSRYDREQELDDTIEVQLRQMREKHDNSN